jgi:hypothetical protein
MTVPISPDTVTLVIAMSNYLKLIVGFGAVAISGWKGVQWVKEIRTKDFKDLRDAVGDTQTSLESIGHKLDSQTSAVVRELQELRSDFRTFYTQAVPQMLPAQSKPKPVRKPKASKVAK